MDFFVQSIKHIIWTRGINYVNYCLQFILIYSWKEKRNFQFNDRKGDYEI